MSATKARSFSERSRSGCAAHSQATECHAGALGVPRVHPALDGGGEHVDVEAGALERAVDRARRGDHLAVVVRREHAHQLAELVGDWRERAHVQHLSRWPQILQRQSLASSVIRGSNSPTRVASITATARSDASCARAGSKGSSRCRRSQVSALVAVKSAACSVRGNTLIQPDLGGVLRIGF